MEDPQENQLEDGRTAESRPNCEECGKNPWKYKCPGCGLRSCGLPCVKAHKERTQCTGKRNRAQFVPISQFDDNWLVSDYNLLEEALRITEAAKRSRTPLGGIRRFPSRPRKAFRNQARNRNTELLFLPDGMSKNETNRSYYNKRRKCIYWTVEWQFHSTDVIFIDHAVDEHVSLRSILEKHLTIGPGNPVSRHKLRHFCKESTENLKLFIKIEYTKGTKNLYFELNITEPLRSQLACKTIIEYPVIHVVLPAQSTQFEVFKRLDQVPEKVVKSSTVDEMEYQKLDDLVHLEGVPFREEEIEEGEFEVFRDLDPVPEKVEKPSTIDKIEHQILDELVHREGLPFKEDKIEEGEFEVFRDLDSVLEKLVKPLTVDKIEDQNPDDLVHQEAIPSREEDIEEGEFEDFRDLDLVTEKVGKPSSVDKMEHQILDELVHQEGLPFREEKIEEGEFEVFRDLDSVLEKLVKPLTVDKIEDQNPDHLVHQEAIPSREEDIEEGEFEDFRDLDPVPEKVVKPQTVDKMEDQNLDDLVHRGGLPFREEEIEEVEFEIFRDLYPVPEKIVKPATIDELEGQNLDDLVHLDSVRFREEEIEEGEFVSNWDFDEDYICR